MMINTFSYSYNNSLVPTMIIYIKDGMSYLCDDQLPRIMNM